MTTAILEKKELLVNELRDALVLFSNELLSVVRAESIAKTTLSGIDTNNPALAHKGINWLAQEILKTIKF